MRVFRNCLIGAVLLAASPALADGWVLNGALSKVAYGSIKKNAVGESNHFSSLSGSVDENGAVRVEIDLTSVETWIDVRNERMIKHVFGEATSAELTAQVDMAELETLAVGELTEAAIEGTLRFLGEDIPIEAELILARLSEDRVMIVTDEMIMVETAALGVDGGIDMLQKLADLPSIARVAPVTLRLVFEKAE